MAEHSSKPGLLWLFFGFNGRIARQSFALAVLFQLSMLTLVLYQTVQAGKDEARLVASGLALMALIVFLLWSVLALAVKRLHDLNMPLTMIAILFLPVLNWLGFFYLMLTPGYPEANDHGPPPFGE